MATEIHPGHLHILAEKVSALNQEIEKFYETYGNAVRVTGRCNYRTDSDDPYFHVVVDISQVVAELS